MRLLYITYKVDAHDTLVGYVVGWLKGLAEHFETIDVICLAHGTADLKPNVRIHSLGKELGASRLARAIYFLKLAWSLTAQADVVFCQFSPEYVLAVAPFAKFFRKRLVLWYTHRHVSWRLRFATWFADRLLTASPESFQIASPKVRVIGHGIDTQRFTPKPELRSLNPKIVLAVGRRAPIKNYELLITLTQFLPSDIHVRIVGGDEGNAPLHYAQTLQAQIDALGLSDRITLVGGVGYDHIPMEYQRASVHVNLCPTGGLDKAVLEGLACGVPTLVRNEGFRPYLGEAVVANAEPQVLAAKVLELLNSALSAGATNRVLVEREFSEAALVQKLARELKSLL